MDQWQVQDHTLKDWNWNYETEAQQFTPDDSFNTT